MRRTLARLRPDRVLESVRMRLRTLSEAECYARCYGGHSDLRVSVVRLLPRRARTGTPSGERLRELFESRLDARPSQAEAA